MSVNSRDKGKRGELEFAAFCREHGYEETRRGQQFRGGGDSPDVVGLPGVHPECKRTECFQPYAAYDQAVMDSEGTGKLPAVFHRRNRGRWMVFLDAEEFLRLIPYLPLSRGRHEPSKE